MAPRTGRSEELAPSPPTKPMATPIAMAAKVTQTVIQAGSKKALENRRSRKKPVSKCIGSAGLADVALRELPLGEQPVIGAVGLELGEGRGERLSHRRIVLAQHDADAVARLARRLSGQDRAADGEIAGIARHDVGDRRP